MSGRERVVFLDRAAFTADELPVPGFDHNWSEYPASAPADVVPRLFWATTAITHACPIDADTIGQLHKLRRIVVTGPAAVDAAACDARGIGVHRLAAGTTLVDLLEAIITVPRQ